MSAPLFDPEVLPHFELTIPEASWDAIDADPGDVDCDDAECDGVCPGD